MSRCLCTSPYLLGACFTISVAQDASVTAYQDIFDNNHGMLDDFVAFWSHAADQFKLMPGVLGYDIMNEPFAGKHFYETNPSRLLVFVLTHGLFDTATVPADTLVLHTGLILYINPSHCDLSHPFVSAQVILLTSGCCAGNFYKDPSLLLPGVAGHKNLQSMYDTVAEAIRKHDDRHIIFYEPGKHLACK